MPRVNAYLNQYDYTLWMNIPPKQRSKWLADQLKGVYTHTPDIHTPYPIDDLIYDPWTGYAYYKDTHERAPISPEELERLKNRR